MSKSAQHTLRTANDIVGAGLAPADERDALERVGQRYAVAISPAIAALIDPADANDPIARQFIPDARELDRADDDRADPIGDDAHSPVPGVVHRYPDRVLLKIASVCPVYCRFCFRREMVGPENGHALTGEELERALAYIAATPRIWEVILTGGDPLVLSDRRVTDVTARLASIAHVKVLRWHTRVPVVQPDRITAALANSLTRNAGDASVWLAVHANHPRELTPDVRAACRILSAAGVHLISQTVLLKDVNDDVAVLEQLMRTFVTFGIKPYYLHHADMAPGTAHFRTSIEAGQEIVRGLRGRLSGLAQPTYVLDTPGGFGKVPLTPGYVAPREDAGYDVTDINGDIHRY